MLQKRTNILFDDRLWNLLSSVSKKENTSIGELVRNAVRKTYLKKEIQDIRQDTLNAIIKIRPNKAKGQINYKELINYGRKY